MSGAEVLSRCAAVAAIALTACGCTSGAPDQAYRLPPTTLEVRELQTRTFQAGQSEILDASVAVLREMEYIVLANERHLGVLSAFKVVDADSAAQKAGRRALDVGSLLLSAWSGSDVGGNAYAGSHDEIGFDLTLVVLPSLAREGEYTARITLQSRLYDKAERLKQRGTIDDPLVYQEIFDKLSSALIRGAQATP